MLLFRYPFACTVQMKIEKKIVDAGAGTATESALSFCHFVVPVDISGTDQPEAGHKYDQLTKS